MSYVYHTNKLNFPDVTTETVSIQNSDETAFKSYFHLLNIPNQIKFLKRCKLHKGLHLWDLRKEHSLKNSEEHFEDINDIQVMKITDLTLDYYFEYGVWVKFTVMINGFNFEHVWLEDEDLEFDMEDNLIHRQAYYFSIPFLHAIQNFYGSDCELGIRMVENKLAFKVLNSSRVSELGEIYDFSYEPPHGGSIKKK